MTNPNFPYSGKIRVITRSCIGVVVGEISIQILNTYLHKGIDEGFISLSQITNVLVRSENLSTL